MNKTEIQAELDKAKRQLASAEKMNFPQAAIDKAKSKIADYESKLAAADKPESKPEKKAAAPKKEKKAKAKKEKAPKPAKVEKTITVKGKVITEKDKDFCDAILSAWNKRVKSARKSSAKSKSRSVSTKIGADVADAVTKGINHAAKSKEFKSNPKSMMIKFKRVNASANHFVSALKSLLGKDFNSSQIKKELDQIDKLVKNIETKLRAKYNK